MVHPFVYLHMNVYTVYSVLFYMYKTKALKSVFNSATLSDRLSSVSYFEMLPSWQRPVTAGYHTRQQVAAGISLQILSENSSSLTTVKDVYHKTQKPTTQKP